MEQHWRKRKLGLGSAVGVGQQNFLDPDLAADRTTDKKGRTYCWISCTTRDVENMAAVLRVWSRRLYSLRISTEASSNKILRTARGHPQVFMPYCLEFFIKFCWHLLQATAIFFAKGLTQHLTQFALHPYVEQLRVAISGVSLSMREERFRKHLLFSAKQ